MVDSYIRLNEETEYLRIVMAQIRENHPTMNGIAMYYKINPVSMGRDKFLLLCKEFGFQVERRKRFRGTTDSSGVVRFPDLLKGKILTDVNQAFSSDITYFEINNCYYYITFIIDCCSRRILGHHVSSRLLTEQTTLPALKMAIKTRKNLLPEGVIFHSDGGGQYYDQQFLKLTKHYKFSNSMCEFAYENGKAERVNGVIKNNYLQYWVITNLKELILSVDRAVKLYNFEKPHKALQYLTPMKYEEKLLNLQQQTRSMMIESFDAKDQDFGASSPKNPEQTRSQNPDVISAKQVEILG